MKQSAIKIIMKIINQFLSLLITTIRPLLGPAVCKYHIGCTDYAKQQLKTKSTIPAIVAITKRVLSCNPFTN